MPGILIDVLTFECLVTLKVLKIHAILMLMMNIFLAIFSQLYLNSRAWKLRSKLYQESINALPLETVS